MLHLWVILEPRDLLLIVNNSWLIKVRNTIHQQLQRQYGIPLSTRFPNHETRLTNTEGVLNIQLWFRGYTTTILNPVDPPQSGAPVSGTLTLITRIFSPDPRMNREGGPLLRHPSVDASPLTWKWSAPQTTAELEPETSKVLAFVV